jgi:hypothetical protein
VPAVNGPGHHKTPKTNQDLKELLGILKLPTQLPCVGIGLFDGSGGKPAGRNQRRAQHAVEVELVLGAGVGVWQRGKHL